MKILLTGGGGLLGRECLVVLSDSHEIWAPGRKDLDITSSSQVEGAVSVFRPQVILNCAAFSHVDRCETEREEAYRTNVLGPRNLARAAARRGCLLVHISTDYVFDGQKPPPMPYLEGDAPAPLSYYGQTKLEGERAVQEEAPRHLIVRTAWLYGKGGQNFLKLILRLALDPEVPEIRVVADQFGSPTWSYRLAHQLARLLAAGAEGLFHASAEGYCTRYEQAVIFLSQLGVVKKVKPCPSRDFPAPAPRPLNSILENGRLKAAGLNLMRPWQEDLAAFVAAFRADLLREARPPETKRKGGGPSR
uniref:dTDP-4-dehydrorhamnose reductase n=1 Tax=Desulfobacca acetoxidans TaxID=60893 RepID=A0A7C5ETY3_9BACT